MSSPLPFDVIVCPECGTRHADSACPACALRQLLLGAPAPEWEDEPALPVPERAQGTEFGRYTLKRRLAAGGMGVVYVADDHKLKRTVALKMIRGSAFANEAELARFTIEAEAAAALDHPNIVPIYEVGHLEDQPFFTMKLITGRSLAEKLRDDGGRLPAREAALLLVDIARAVHHAHQRGVLHRDLKPGNILVDEEGRPWLTDFGLAKLAHAESGLTLSSDHIGTPHYMAPEVAGGTARQAATAGDVWALGVILWEMLSGATPFRGAGAVEIMRRIVDEEPSWSGSARVDADLVTLARRCLEKDPARRPSTAGEVAEELERWLRGEPIKARPVTARERFFKWVKRKPALAALYAALAAGAVSGLFLWQRAEEAVVSLTQTNEQLGQSLRVATATKLAGDARQQVGEDPARALLLAVEAVEMTEKTATGVLPEAASSLTAVLQLVGGLDASVGGVKDSYSDPMQNGDWPEKQLTQVSPDSRRLVTLRSVSQSTVRAALFDLTDPDGRTPAREWDLLTRWTGTSRYAFRWMPDSRHLLGCGEGDGLFLLDMDDWASGSPRRRVLTEFSEPGLRMCDVMLQGTGGIIVWKREDTPGLYSWARFEAATPETFTLGPRIEAPAIGTARNSASLSDSGRWFVLGPGEEKGPVWLWDRRQPGAPPLLLEEMSNILFEAHFRPDERQLVLWSGGNIMHCYDLPGEEGGSPVRHQGEIHQPSDVRNVAYSPDNRWFAAAGRDGSVVLTDTRDGDRITLWLGSGTGIAVTFSADGRWLAAGGGGRSVHVWDMQEIQNNRPPLEFRGLPLGILHIAFSPDGRTLLAGGQSGQAVRRWQMNEASSGSEPHVLPAGRYQARSLALSPDRSWVAFGNGAERRPDVPTSQGLVTMARLDGTSSLVLGSHETVTSSVAFSQDGQWLASTGLDVNVKVWPVAAALQAATAGTPPPEPRFTLPMTGTRPHFERHVAFHPRGTLYAVCGDGLLFEWDLTQADPSAEENLYVVHTLRYLLPALAISPDGHWLAIARHGWDKPTEGDPQHGNQVLLFDVSQPGPPEPVTQLDAAFLYDVSFAFTSDSRWLAAGAAGKPVTVWDLAAADIPASIRRAPASAQTTPAVAFSPDDRWLALGGSDGRLHFWDWRQNGQLRSIETGAAIFAATWLPDARIITVGASTRAAVWDTDLTRLKALARRTAGRSLSQAERLRFRLSPQ